MNQELLKKIEIIFQKTQTFFEERENIELGYKDLQLQELESLIEKHLNGEPVNIQQRIRAEFNGWGPLESLIHNEQISEIIILSHENIFYELKGQMTQLEDRFLNNINYVKFIERLIEWAHLEINQLTPFCDGFLNSLRIHLVSPSVTKDSYQLCLRKHRENKWNLEELQEMGSMSPSELEKIKFYILQKKNILIIGNTGSGKTSLLSACLKLADPLERIVILEDTSEIEIPNKISTKLLTRKSQNLPEINLHDLMKQSLRMRPDRIILGEVRGDEAKDLILALSSGHRGCLCSLHAESPQQALKRLETLVQLGAPQWNVKTVRDLIFDSIDVIISLNRLSTGERKIEGIYELSSLEESGILVENIKEIFVGLNKDF
jgi:pilus assembly protein CpaF